MQLLIRHKHALRLSVRVVIMGMELQIVGILLGVVVVTAEMVGVVGEMGEEYGVLGHPVLPPVVVGVHKAEAMNVM